MVGEYWFCSMSSQNISRGTVRFLEGSGSGCNSLHLRLDL